jgi:hypothetical protein
MTSCNSSKTKLEVIPDDFGPNSYLTPKEFWLENVHETENFWTEDTAILEIETIKETEQFCSESNQSFEFYTLFKDGEEYGNTSNVETSVSHGDEETNHSALSSKSYYRVVLR